MAVKVELQNTGDSTVSREITATIEHVLFNRAGDLVCLYFRLSGD
jgi:hypothetical protein